MASDCPEPDVCIRCCEEWLIKDDCLEPEKYFNSKLEIRRLDGQRVEGEGCPPPAFMETVCRGKRLGTF